MASSASAILMTLLIGKERFLKREFILSLRQRLFSADANSELNFMEFTVGQESFHSFLGFLLTTPFAADHRLAVLWGVDLLSVQEQTKLMVALEKLPASSVCVFESEQTNVKKNVFLARLAHRAKVTPCHTPFERELPAWVESRAKKIGCSIDRNAALFLIACIGADLAGLDSALQQTSLLVHPKQTILLRDVQDLFQKKSQEDVFQLAEFLHDQRRDQVLRVTEALFGRGIRVPEIIAVLAGQLDRWKKAARQQEAGRSLSEIAEELRVPVFFQESFFTRLKILSMERIHALNEALLLCDETFKSGQAEERLAFEKFIWTT